MDADQILAFRRARLGLAERDARSMGAAAACPISDFAAGSALGAVATRHAGTTRAGFDAAVDAGKLVMAHGLRGAIHAVAPGDRRLFGSALLSDDDVELAFQLGDGVRKLLASTGISATEALATVRDATTSTLARGAKLDRVELHAALRETLDDRLLPWCAGCRSHHAPPMLWRYALVAADARLDSERRYLLDAAGRSRKASGAVLRYLEYYGPGTPGEFATWTGIRRSHADRLWAEVAGELTEVVGAGGRKAWVRTDDVGALGSPPASTGVRLLSPGDPYLTKVNRELVAPDPALRKRLFRPVASPGVVLKDGRIVGSWRAKAAGSKLVVTVDTFGQVAKGAVAEEAERIVALREKRSLELVWS